jgi:hypothetical protein
MQLMFIIECIPIYALIYKVLGHMCAVLNATIFTVFSIPAFKCLIEVNICRVSNVIARTSFFPFHSPLWWTISRLTSVPVHLSIGHT